MALNGNGIWHHILRKKYLKNHTVEEWLRTKKFYVRGTLYFWNGFIRTLTWITRLLGWRVGNGQNILLGSDPIIGMDSYHILSEELREYLLDYGLHTLWDARHLGCGLNKQS